MNNINNPIELDRTPSLKVMEATVSDKWNTTIWYSKESRKSAL